MTELNILTKQFQPNKRAHDSIDKMLNDTAYLELLKSKASSYTSWMNEDFPTNPKYPEQLKHDTVNNLKVRSKAESFIAVCLNQAGIPFRYEWLLELEGIDFYPDFTIIKPSTGRIYRWEHFGRMDDPKYLSEFKSKIPIYIRNGLVPGDNLIMSFESLDQPLTYTTINKLIELHLN